MKTPPIVSPQEWDVARQLSMSEVVCADVRSSLHHGGTGCLRLCPAGLLSTRRSAGRAGFSLVRVRE